MMYICYRLTTLPNCNTHLSEVSDFSHSDFSERSLSYRLALCTLQVLFMRPIGDKTVMLSLFQHPTGQ